MAYRDDHEAALARADALEAELEVERAKHDRDGARIAELEAELARRPAKRVTVKRDRSWSKRTWVVIGSVAVLVVTAAIVIAVLRHQAKWAAVADGWDVQHYLDEATTEANKRITGATISKLVAPHVNSNGQAQLTMNRTGSIDIWFASSQDLTQCLHARVGRESTSLTYANATGCDVVVPGPLHCSISNVLVRAMQNGLPAGALASVRLSTEYGKRRWEVVPEHGTQHFDDDCP